MSNPVVILGAGLTGLGAARHLPGSIVYEAKGHVGGHVYSHEQGGIFFDEGAHICHAKDESWKREIFANAGEVVSIPQSRVSNWWHGRWVTYPVQNHLRDLPVALRDQGLAEILAAQANPAVTPPSNYDEWCRRQYGDFITDHFYHEYTEKYWRTPMVDMDTDWLSGRLLPSQMERILEGAFKPVNEAQSVFSSFYYPTCGGFFAFFKKFYRDIDVRTGFKIERLSLKDKRIRFANGKSSPFDRCISTIPLNDLIRAIDDVPDAIRLDAETLRHTQLIGVNVLINKPKLVPYHWFYVYDPDIEISRVKVLSNIIPAVLPAGATVLQTEIFRRDDEPFDVESLKLKAVQELARILGFDADRDVEAVSHLVVSHAYTIPTLGRQAAVDRIAGWLETQGIVTAGLYGRWQYIWSDQAYEAGKKAAEKLVSAITI